MNSRERVLAVLNHEIPDKIPLDLGATNVTGINASTLYKLRKALNLPEKPIIIQQVYQMLGAVEEDIRQVLGVDVVGLFNPADMKKGISSITLPFSMSDNTPVLFPDNIAYTRRSDGSVVLYPHGDPQAHPSWLMPEGGFFFDAIERAPPIDEGNLTPVEDFEGTFLELNENCARYLEAQSQKLYNSNDLAIVGVLTGGGLGDILQITGPNEKEPKGIRRVDDWIMAHIMYPDYIKTVFRMQTDTMLKNFKIYNEAVGDRIQIISFSGTDFGTQNGPFIGPELFRELYKPFYEEMNDWVHKNTKWKTFYHSCGSIVDFLDDFVEMGVDILNPIQISAKGMDAKLLKEKYGKKLVFWGGGIDTQNTLPFGTPEEVKAQVKERLAILGTGGGYCFTTIQNIIAKVPVENVIAMFRAFGEFTDRDYRLL
jgi:hypothetical protein